MSDSSDLQEQAIQEARRRGFSREQIQTMQQLASQMASHQVRQAITATNNFISTVATLISSALGFVAAFAWNDAIQSWIKINTGDSAQAKTIYALTATAIAVIAVSVLGFINTRILKSNRNLLTTDQPPR
jgi:CO/xanthine dehydrogenase FAD-binding subunit